MRANEPLDTAHISSWARSRLSQDTVPHFFLSQTNLTIIPSNKKQCSREFQILATVSVFHTIHKSAQPAQSEDGGRYPALQI